MSDAVFDFFDKATEEQAKEHGDPVHQFLDSGGSVMDEASAPHKPLSWMEKYVTGPAEAALTMATGAIAAPIAAVSGVAKNIASGKYGTREGLQIADARRKEVQDSLTYQPRKEGGRNALETVSDVLDASKLAGLGPTESMALAATAPARATTSSLRSIAAGPKESVIAERPAFGSVGASAAAKPDMVRAQVANSSPELQAIVEDHLKKKLPVNQEALNRHVEAHSLPVKIDLTQGQATQDVGLISQEQNMRGKKEAFRDRFNKQNEQLIENTNAIKESAAPDVFAQSKPEHGEILIDAYKAKDAKLNADISAKYQALRDANGGNFPLDSKAFVDAADAALHKQLLFDQVPSGLRTTLDRLKEGGSMTFENFESLRTNLARIQRSQADGNVKHAAGIIRKALEDLPMPPGAENLKPLADAARTAARERFALIEKDPAYKAVVNGKASADHFIEKHVIGADLAAVKTMKDNLDQTAHQAIASGVINHLKQRAGVIEDTGNFSQAGYNKAIESIRPKLDVIFEPEHKRQLETLGRVARYTQAQPRGSFVNNSNTLVGLMSESAKSTVEGAANVAAKGVPIGTWTRKLAQARAEHQVTKQSLQTGAGIRLKDIK